jgi:hypothetical protein
VTLSEPVPKNPEKCCSGEGEEHIYGGAEEVKRHLRGGGGIKTEALWIFISPGLQDKTKAT